MNSLAFFLLQIGIPLFFGLLVTAYLRSVTQRLLADLCGTADRAAFWVRISAVLTISAPVALVLQFGQSSLSVAPLETVVRQAISLSLIGVLAAVALLANAIRVRIPKTAPKTADGVLPRGQA